MLETESDRRVVGRFCVLLFDYPSMDLNQSWFTSGFKSILG